MKKLILAAGLVLAAALTGCMQLEMDTVLNDHGGGTYTFSLSMSQDVESALTELSELDGGGMGDEMDDMPDFANFDRSAFEQKLKGFDVKLKSFTNEVKDDRRMVKMVLDFGNFEGMQAAMASVMGGDDSVIITKLDDGNYRLEPGDSGISFDEEEDDGAEEAEPNMEDMEKAMANAGKSMEIMGRLMAHSSELSMIMRITLPSDVIEHNAPEIEGRTCTWEVNSENMMAAQGMEPRITFSGKGVDIK